MRYIPAPVPTQNLTNYLGNELRRLANATRFVYQNDGSVVMAHDDGTPIVESEREGPTTLFHGDNPSVVTDALGMRVIGSDTVTTLLAHDEANNVRRGFLTFRELATGPGELRSEDHGNLIRISGEDAGGTLMTLAEFITDSANPGITGYAGQISVDTPANPGFRLKENGSAVGVIVYNTTANQMVVRGIETACELRLEVESGSNPVFRADLSGATRLAFHGTAPIAKPTVTGSRGGNAALASLCTALANLGLIVNSTS
jgi:hypothetical protein